ncbi:TlpA family protein disulfide reductase [Tenacibaculum amylolyticum]|uniref:TlpA family protein disulfide reductase n=1 Tax=Tenacibaculum amylolyticum TaxID=104269 RepID=UPI00389334BF
MKRLVTLLLLVITSSIFAQKTYYNQAVNSCADKSSDELINKCIKGSYLLNYDFETDKGTMISTDKIKKPILLIAAAGWSAPAVAQIPAINEMVDMYGDKMEFIVIFWDKKDKIKRFQDRLNPAVKLVPARDGDKVERGNLDISGFVHKLDYPTAYLIDKSKKFTDVLRGAATPSKGVTWDDVNDKNGEDLEAFIQQVIK